MTKRTSFWGYQLASAWRNFADRPAVARTYSLLNLARETFVRHHSASASPMVGTDIADDDKLTVIVLNHKRPQNVGQIAQYVLRAGFVRQMIISNNSQAYRIEDYVRVSDARLILLNHPEPSGVGISMELAREYPARYYLRIDDDIFLHPAQLQWIYWNLRQRPDRPHGIFGAAFTPKKDPAREWPFDHRRNSSGAVEILNGLFAFTREHLEEYLRLCPQLGIIDQRKLMNGEDIVLSFSGRCRPMIHNVGPIWECASEASPEVALHQSRPRFYEERWKIYSELERIKPLANEED